MAIVSIELKHDGDAFSSVPHYDEITRTWFVEVDGAADTVEDYQVVTAAIATGQVPYPGAYYPAGTLYRAYNMTATCVTPGDRRHWLLTGQMSNQPRGDRDPDDSMDEPKGADPNDPTQDPLTINVSSVIEERDAFHFDRDGNIADSTVTGEMLDPPVRLDDSNALITVSGNSVNPTAWHQIVGSINSTDCYITAVDPYSGTKYSTFCPAGSGIIRDFSCEGPNFRDAESSNVRNTFYKNTLAIELRSMVQDFSEYELFTINYARSTGLDANVINPLTHPYFAPKNVWPFETGGVPRVPWLHFQPHRGLNRDDGPAAPWIDATEYEVGDTVSYPARGTFNCILAHTSAAGINAPTAGANNKWWSFYSDNESATVIKRIVKRDVYGTSVNGEDGDPIDKPVFITKLGEVWKDGDPIPLQVIFDKRSVDWTQYPFATSTAPT